MVISTLTCLLPIEVLRHQAVTMRSLMALLRGQALLKSRSKGAGMFALALENCQAPVVTGAGLRGKMLCVSIDELLSIL